jgi:glutamate racemase
MKKPIGVFDSGFGGLTVFKAIKTALPEYDYIYLGDNARAPYGNRNFEKVFEYTWQCVKWLYSQGCGLVILACNTASAKALRKIQQEKLKELDAQFRVLGVIRPTAEVLGAYTKTNYVGVLATQGTVTSNSYPVELHKFYPQVQVYQQACPLWVPFIENGSAFDEAAAYYIQKDVATLMAQSEKIDTVLMACTHYPIIESLIKKYLPENVTLLGQGDIVAQSLKEYLLRHSDLENILTKHGVVKYYSTESASFFEQGARIFLEDEIICENVAFF